MGWLVAGFRAVGFAMVRADRYVQYSVRVAVVFALIVGFQFWMGGLVRYYVGYSVPRLRRTEYLWRLDTSL